MRTVMTIAGTHCPACQTLLEEVAREQQGVQACSVDFTTGQTVIDHDASFDAPAFTAVVNQLGPYRINLAR